MRPDHAAYIASRLKVLCDDKFRLLGRRARATPADYLRGLQPQEIGCE
jgi:antirestriction protein ArdC